MNQETKDWHAEMVCGLKENLHHRTGQKCVDWWSDYLVFHNQSHGEWPLIAELMVLAEGIIDAKT